MEKVMTKRLISVCIVVSLVCGIYGCAQTAKDGLVAEPETVETENTEETDTADAETTVDEEASGQEDEETNPMSDAAEQEKPESEEEMT